MPSTPGIEPFTPTTDPRALDDFGACMRANR
jgi:hypothetical protein